MLKAYVYQGVTILRNARSNRFVALCPYSNGVWGPYRSLYNAKKEIRAWNLPRKPGVVRAIERLRASS